jgi:hypothetical protein
MISETNYGLQKMESNEIRNEVEKLFTHFTKIHHTEAIRRIYPNEDDFSSIRNIIHIFNQRITWAKTKEGYVYYYILNLRWILGITYLCIKYSMINYPYCISALNRYIKYRGSGLTEEERKKYHKFKGIYEKRIEKIVEIFGN